MRKPQQPIAPEAIQTIKDWQIGKEQKYGKNKIIPAQPRWFVSYPYMIAIMAVLQVLTALYNRHFMTFFGFDISFGSLFLFPWVIFIFQIAAECYGWQYARQIVWCNFLVNGMLTLVTFSARFVEYSPLNHLAMKTSYITLVDTMWVACAMSWFVIFISDYLTSALTSWSRFHWSGRFLILRTIILNVVSESILLSSSFVILPFNGYSMENTIHTVYNIFIARIIISILLLPVVRYIIWYIQNRVEKVVVFDYRKDFNPFKFGIDPSNSVQFNADGWAKINVGKIDIKKLGQAYSDEFFEEHERQIKERIEQNN